MKRLQQRILVECEKTVTWTPSARKQYRTVLVFKFSTDGRIQKLRIESASESPQIDSELLKIFMGLPQPEPLPTGLQAEDVDVEFTVRCCGLRNPGALAGSSGSEPTSTTDGTVTGHIVRFKPSPIAAPQSPDKTQRVTSPDLVP